MANVTHDQLAGSDLHENKVNNTTGTELTPPSQAIYDGRWKTPLDNHVANTSNPHATTAAQIGATPTSRTLATTTPLAGGGDLSVNRTLSIQVATTSQGGYLSATDWTTFNAKQAKAFVTVGFAGSGADYICDGTADQVEIKAAIDAVDAVGGGVVRLLPGTYNFSASISCTLLNHYNNISIIGSGRGATILKAVANNVSILAFGSGDANAGIVPKNLHFAHFTLDMNNTTGAAYGMAIACCQDVSLDNLHFKNQANGAKSMLFFGVSANASSAMVPRHLLATNCIFSDSNAQWEAVTLAQSLDCKFVNCIFRDKTAIYSFLNYSSYDVACVGCEFINCSNGVNGHGETIFSGCNFFGAGVTVQADNTIFVGCSFRNILAAYAGGIKYIGYETTSNEQGWDEPGSSIPIILKNNKVIGCNFDHCNTVALQAATFAGTVTGTHLSCKDLTIIGCKFANIYWQGVDVKAETLTIKDCESYNNGQLGSSTVKYNFVIGAKYGFFGNNHSYDDQSTPTVVKDFFIDNQLSATVLPTMDLTFRDCRFDVGGVPSYYTGAGFTPNKPTNITLRGTNNLGINPEVTYNQGNVTGSVTFDRKNGRTIAATLTGNLTPTFAVGIFDGEELNLELTQDAMGNRSCAKPVNSKVPGGVLPISTAANARDLYRFKWARTSWDLVGYQLNLS